MQIDEKMSFERVGLLRARIMKMYKTGISFSELGSVALDLLALRNETETRPLNMSEQAKGRLSESLRDLEKTVISLYMLSRLEKQKPRKVMDYLPQEYPIYNR